MFLRIFQRTLNENKVSLKALSVRFYMKVAIVGGAIEGK